MSRLATGWIILFAVAVAGLIAAGVLAWDWYSVVPPEEVTNAHYVGRDTCIKCHQRQYDLWHGSDHDRAMALATDESVEAHFNNTKFEYHGVTTHFFRQNGKFMVNTEGPDGEYHDYQIKYTFGVRPLQQYMIEFPDGRVQVLRESWDVKKKKWFFVTPPDVTNERIKPGDPLHWTGIAQNWNTTCADCHSTNIHKNYDSKTNTYKTSWEEINVGCEECHGPGSVHVKLAERWSPFWDRNIGYGLPPLKDRNLTVQIEMCAKCHARRYQVHEGFRPGRPFMDYYEPVVLSAGLYQADGQILDEDYEYDSFLQSKMFANHVRCSDCHEPHSLKLRFEGNRLCAQCHDAAKFDTTAHHHHQAGTPGAQCINCHMASRLYMVIDERRDHSFRIPRPDLSKQLGTTNACTNCHTAANETNQWAADAIKKWYGDKTILAPHWGPAFKAAAEASPDGEKLLVELLHRNTTPAVVKATAVDLLTGYSSANSAAARREALRDFDPLVRLSGVRSLPDDSENMLATELAGVVDDPVRSVRVAAAARLGQLPLKGLTNDQRKAFDKAATEFRESQKLQLDHAGGHLTLASFDRAHGRFDDAIAHLKAAIKLEPYLAGPRAELASLLQERNGDPKEIRQLREEEANLVERDSKYAPDNPDIFYRLGLLRYTLDEFDQAETALRTACEKAPQNYEYLMALALLQERRYTITGNEDQLKAAMMSLDALRHLNKNDPRGKMIFQRLYDTYKAKNPGAAATIEKN
jgi:tetratricopeptide (TPR) repeat protein